MAKILGILVIPMKIQGNAESAISEGISLFEHGRGRLIIRVPPWSGVMPTTV
jgi:hypothetical protein